MSIEEWKNLTPLVQALTCARELLTRFDKELPEYRKQADLSDDYRPYDEFVFESGEDALSILRDFVACFDVNPSDE